MGYSNDLLMDSSFWTERLYEDESLTDNLGDDDAMLLLRWAEERLASCGSESEAAAVMAMVREVNRRVGEGESFADLLDRLHFSPDPDSNPSGPMPPAP